MHAFDYFSLFQLSLGHSADAVGAEVSVAGLYAAEAAEALIAGFLPFSNQVGISYSLLQAVVVEVLGYDFAAVIHVVDISGLLMMDLENWPQGFVDALSFV